jgi:hypothetical protein
MASHAEPGLTGLSHWLEPAFMAEAERVRPFKRPESKPGLLTSPPRTGLVALRESRLKAAE